MYRILSLDGGGSWAVIQVMALQRIFGQKATGHEVLAHFDLAAANSGGSITLGGLLEDKTLDSLVNDFYLQEAQRRKIFVEAGVLDDIEAAGLRQIGIGAKYLTRKKFDGLRDVLAINADVPLSRLRPSAGTQRRFPDLLICAFDYDRTRGVLFRSNLKSAARNGETFIDPTVAEAVHASSTAPVLYFNAPAIVQKRQFWDGGIAGYNNPVLLAAIEAMANGVKAHEIWALSIGTGTVFLPLDLDGTQNEELVQRPRHQRAIADLSELAGAIVDDPPDIASFHAHVALGGDLRPVVSGKPITSRIVRLNPLIQPIGHAGDWQVPQGLTLDEFKALRIMPMDAIEDDRVRLIFKFGQSWLDGHVLNQPIRVNRDTMDCEIGYRSFEDGVSAWRAGALAPAEVRAASA